MALAVLPRFDTGERTVGPESPKGTLRYTVIDAADEFIAAAAVEAVIPALYAGLIFQNYQLSPQGGGVFDVSVEYAKKKQDGPDSPTSGTSPKQDGDGPHTAADWEFSFDTTGGTHKVMKSFGTRTLAKGLLNLMDLKGAINFKKGPPQTVEGVEVGTPVFSFTLKGKFKPPLPAGWVANVYHMTAKVNSDRVIIIAHGAQLIFEPGELLFKGLTGGLKGENEDVDVTMNFAASENAVFPDTDFFPPGVAIGQPGDPVDQIKKLGWEYLWIRQAPTAASGQFIPEILQVFVEQVYKTADLTPLLTPFNS